MIQRCLSRWFAAGLVGALPLMFAGGVFAGDALQFNRDIRPILSDRCFKCHGPDKAARKANLRLDQSDSAYAPRKDPHAHAIVPGQPAQSLVVEKIFSRDPDDQMPPPQANLSLTAAEKEKIRRWISEGAKYQPHWAFIPPPDIVPVPAVNTRWPRNDIDRFILARLESEKIKPSPEADKSRWLRRVTYDLTGLPPAPAEVAAFLGDNSKTAYESVVDRLLASKHFGERLAVPWLDAARYADSYGYQSDLLCPTWPYRDWVVNAFNQNLPYDKFLIEQLAGDLLPHATRDERLATAFNRLHRETNEGGSIAEEYREEYVSDRIQTFSTAMMAMTFQCAHCHDHKFDPILQRDYYSLGAFFNSIDEYGLYFDTAHVPTPSLLLPTAEQQAAMALTKKTLLEKNDALTQAAAGSESAFDAWLARPPATAEIPGLVAYFKFDALAGTNQIMSELNTNDLSPSIHGNTLAAGKEGQALQFSGDDEFRLPERFGNLQPWDQYSFVFWVRIPAADTNAIILHATKGTDVGFFGTELSLDDGRLFFAVKRFWPGNAIAIRSEKKVPTDQWVQLGISYDGSGDAAGLKLFLDGEPVAAEIERNHLVKSPQNNGGSVAFGARFRSSGLKDGLLDELRVYNRPLAPVEVRQLFDGHALSDALAQKDAEPLRSYYLAAVAEPVTQARADRAAALRKYLETRDPIQEISVMEELPAPRPAYLLARGRYDAPQTDATRVTRSTPAMLPPFSANLPHNRLGLAEWLTDPHHPLTARVAVNRYWQMIFGRGIVGTADNFGVQGDMPTHPELLDWLARDFINSGWDTKALLRKMVLSATYRQDSKFRQDLRDTDPENLLLARGPSQRLPAEMIRDTALAASGLLQDELGGPPVSPYLPGDLWRESNVMSPAYHQSVGQALYRRSLYTVWKRTAPMPDMTAFDAPSREYCVVKRSATATPQQAFVLLNDPQFVEAARVLAEKAIKESGDSADQRVRFIFLRLAARDPQPRELELLNELLRDQTERFEKEPDRARSLVSVGDTKADPKLNLAELAATTEVAQTILNLDATVWKR